MRITVRRLGFVAVGAGFILFGARPCSAQVQRALLSVDGMIIPSGGALAAFRIETWGVVPLAVCKVPPQWALEEEKFMDPEGFLAGTSDPYHRTLWKLEKLYLVDVYSYQPLPKGDPKGEYHPASFAGWFKVFDGNGDILKKRRAFHAGNFHLTPASQCPEAPPPDP